MTTTPDRTDQMMAVVDATWPPAERISADPFVLRRGGGGGKRVSAASARRGDITAAEIAAAETAMRAMDQPPLFSIRPADAALDAMLAARGYDIVDPVWIYTAPVDALATLEKAPERVSLTAWDPLAIQREIWAAGGIGPARLAVMDRAAGPKTSLIGRHENSPGGTAFVAVHDGIAMLHALEVVPEVRGRGMGRAMMIDAARWARDQGARELAVVVTRANVGGNALYRALGMAQVGQYHYRLGS